MSVIVPTYDRPVQLASCLQALAQLDYPCEKLEVIVVDDGSARSPENVVNQFSELIDVRLLSQANAGPAAARNFGALHARGECFAFTDDDCAPEAGWLRALAVRFAQAPDSILGGRTVNALPDNLCAETSQLIIDTVYSHFNPRPGAATFFAANNLAFSAKRFRELRGFNQSFTTSEDREICDRWRALGLSLKYVPNALVYHAHHLAPRKLWRQHFGYGRGAYRFHMARAEATGEKFKPDLAFYLKLLLAPASQLRRRRKFLRAIQLMALLMWSQVANTAGFLYESCQSHIVAMKSVPQRGSGGSA